MIGSRAKTKCYFINNDTGKHLECQFNPESMPYSRSANFTEISSPGMAYPLVQFTGGNVRDVPLKLFYYDPSGKIIKAARKFFNDLLPPEKNTKKFRKPPSFTFAYGYFVKKYVLTELEVDDTMLNSDGVPTMTTFTLNMKQISNKG